MKTLADQSGLTIVELMIAMTIGLLLILIATGLLLSSRAAYVARDQHIQVQETGRYAMEILSRAIRQAGYRNPDTAYLLPYNSAEREPDVVGMDAASLKRSTAGMDVAGASAVVNGSDVLALRFSGDIAIFNCAGFAVPAPASPLVAGEDNGGSIFFVGRDRSGEPELRCKYRSRQGWNADAIARGIESFQVLYGVDVDGDAAVDRYVNASDIEAMDDAMTLRGENAIVRLADRKRRTHWKKVRSVKVSILVRSAQSARYGDATTSYHLFDDAYTDTSDIGVHISEMEIARIERKRIRKVFTQTIQLRNGNAAVVLPGRP